MNIELKNVSKKYNDKIIFSSLNFTFLSNTITCITGPSGIGKTTLVNMISNVTDYTGEITPIDNISYVFQETRLIDTLTVSENLEYVIKKIYKNKQERTQIINNILDKTGLSENSNHYPKELSGGMKQRVSIARAFIYPSSLLIIDEPFKELDLNLKNKIIKEFMNLLKENKKTVIYITHDINEAKSITDNIYKIISPSEIIKINNKVIK